MDRNLLEKKIAMMGSFGGWGIEIYESIGCFFQRFQNSGFLRFWTAYFSNSGQRHQVLILNGVDKIKNHLKEFVIGSGNSVSIKIIVRVKHPRIINSISPKWIRV